MVYGGKGFSEMIKVALTHDVDRIDKIYQYLQYPITSLLRGNFGRAWYHLSTVSKWKTVYWNFEKLTELEDKYGVRSTFFYLIETIPFDLFKPSEWNLALGRYDIRDKRILTAIETLKKGGWEIGLHGSYNSYKDLNLLKWEKKTLEEAAGLEVTGIRQHYLNMNNDTWQIQKDAGFLYDTTLGYNNTIGFMDGKVAPFSPFHDHFVEFPMTMMDFCFNAEKDKWKLTEKITSQAEENDGIIVLNWHPDNLDEGDFPGFFRDYENLIQFYKEKGARFDTLKNYYAELKTSKI